MSLKFLAETTHYAVFNIKYNENKIIQIVEISCRSCIYIRTSFNVVVTLDDPFLFMSDVAIATGETNSCPDETGTEFYKMQTCWTRAAYRITSIDGTIGGGLTFNVGDIMNTELKADAGCSVTYSQTNQYEITCPATTILQTVVCQIRGWEECSIINGVTKCVT